MIAATQIVATERLKSSLREHLTRNGYGDAHIENAISLIDFEDSSVKFQTMYAQCVKTIVQLESRPPKAMGSTVSYRDVAATPVSGVATAGTRNQLKEIGYTDQQVADAVANGCADVESIVQYLLSVEPVSKAPAPSAPPSSSHPAAAAIGAAVSADGLQLVCAFVLPVSRARLLADTVAGVQGLAVPDRPQAKVRPVSAPDGRPCRRCCSFWMANLQL